MTVTPERWYHGTTPERGALILESGAFRPDTWFAKECADAIRFGGPYVFEVGIEIDGAPLGWQIHLANALSISAIVRTEDWSAAP